AGLVQKAGEAGVTVVAQTTLQAWIKSGGLNRMKSIGFDVSLLGLSAASSSALTETYRWQYAVPILGTAYAAYLWSDKLMSASDIIEKNGKEIYRIRKEKFRIRQALGS
ncbi:MAG: hypothetical protein EB078_13580, partial [Proteobacteria bacterium]|nr:hypothetical protein [Pseudomonadota bacterium]NDG26160.1 hypothetical protein [Pseudomonadota bacterium]